jgi:hypothetical protein
VVAILKDKFESKYFMRELVTNNDNETYSSATSGLAKSGGSDRNPFPVRWRTFRFFKRPRGRISFTDKLL